MAYIPQANQQDSDDVAWALQTATALWERGDYAGAVSWLRRSAAAASSAGDQARAAELENSAKELAESGGDDSASSLTLSPAASTGWPAILASVRARMPEGLAPLVPEEATAEQRFASDWDQATKTGIAPGPPPPPVVSPPARATSERATPPRVFPLAPSRPTEVTCQYPDPRRIGSSPPEHSGWKSPPSAPPPPPPPAPPRPMSRPVLRGPSAPPPPPPPPPPPIASDHSDSVVPPVDEVRTSAPPLGALRPPRPSSSGPLRPFPSVRPSKQAPKDSWAPDRKDLALDDLESLSEPSTAISDEPLSMDDAGLDAEAVPHWSDLPNDLDPPTVDMTQIEQRIPSAAFPSMHPVGLTAVIEKPVEAPAVARPSRPEALSLSSFSDDLEDLEDYGAEPLEGEMPLLDEVEPTASSVPARLALADDPIGQLDPLVQQRLVALATVRTLARDEEVSGFALARVTVGEVVVASMISDVPAVKLRQGAVLCSRGSLEEPTRVRLIGASDHAEVQLWSAQDATMAFAALETLMGHLRKQADWVLGLVHASMGMLGEELSPEVFLEMGEHLSAGYYPAGEIVIAKDSLVSGLMVLGLGSLTSEGDWQVAPGDVLFPRSMMNQTPVHVEVRAGKAGAVVLRESRRGLQGPLVDHLPALRDVLGG